jgi:hypothetical protein
MGDSTDAVSENGEGHGVIFDQFRHQGWQRPEGTTGHPRALTTKMVVGNEALGEGVR